MASTRAWLCAVIVLSQAAPGTAAPQGPEAPWVDAARDFDHLGDTGRTIGQSGLVVAAEPAAESAASASIGRLNFAASDLSAFHGSTQLDFVGPGGAPKEQHELPSGIGPISFDEKPGYFKGLLGGLLGMILAPVALAVETAQAVIMTPVRMIKGLAEGDPLALLEPVRTVKNLAQDAVMTGVGMLNCATAPVWNAIHPEESTDFVYANDRLIFLGGPLPYATNAVNQATVPKGFAALPIGGFTPSWHTVFLREAPSILYGHEFKHSKQWERSFLFEHVGHDGDDWEKADPAEYLNI